MKIKKLTAFFMAVVITLSCFAFGIFNASAKTQEIILDTEMINTTDGLDDKNWYYYTPSQTGIYTFLSYNRYLYAEAYLFIKEGKNYTQLGYSNESPNYEYYSQPNKYQFCLSYKLEAGKTYYYAAGWDSERTGGEMKVKLIYEGSEEDIIDHIGVECNAQLSWYTNGSWERDSQGEAYFYYNYSKIIQNMVVTVYYINGSESKSALGADEVDGYKIKYTQNQDSAHWYPKEDEKYTQNILTVSILDKSAEYNVVINQDALFTVYGSVSDYISNEAVSGAVIRINGSEVAVTDSQGNFSFVSAPGIYNASVSGSNIISREFKITVNVNSEMNNHTANPIGVVTGDYVQDGIINAKDFAYITKTLSGEKQESEAEKFSQQIHFKSENYPNLVI